MSSPGLTGRSSIPETPVLEPIGRGVLDHPLARVMTAEGVTSFFQDKSQRSRGATGVRVLLDFTLRIEEGAGKAGRWPRPWPASNKKSWRQSPQVWPRRPGPPCAMALRLIRDLPGARALLPPSSAKSSLADLTPASGCQDHTISSSASAPFVRARASRASPKRPSHPASRVVTIAIRPS